MERYIDMKEVSDGHLYDINDMVRADCHGCEGCSDCCYGMGASIVLDPLDITRLCKALNTDFNSLLAQQLIELNVQEGLILPNLRMHPQKGCCTFLGEDGRCTVHESRPGYCRIFPLGRIYENHRFRYFLQINECSCGTRSKIKVRKWIDIPDYRENERFIIQWHYLLKDISGHLNGMPEENPELRKEISMYLLNTFYIFPFNPEKDFYAQFNARLQVCRALMRDHYQMNIWE